MNNKTFQQKGKFLTTMKTKMKMMALLLCVATVISTTLLSCDSAYHRKTNKMIAQCEQSLKQDDISKSVSDIIEIKVMRKLTQKQSDKVRQLEKQINERKQQIEQEQIAIQKGKEDQERQARRQKEQEERQREQEKREWEEAECNRQIANEAYTDVMQLQDEVRLLIDKMASCRSKMSYSAYGSYDYQNARIEYNRFIGTAIEKQKKAIRIARDKIHDESFVEELSVQLELLKAEKKSENETDARRGREFGRRGY